MQNRGASFSLDAGALNYLRPGRLPFHTLNPALAVLNDGRVMAYGCMGGDGQPQTQSALFTRYVDFREPLFEAIDRPRWVLGRTWGAPRTALRLEPRFDGNLDRPARRRRPRCRSSVRALFRRHGPRRRRGAAPGRQLEGAHDPRADGGAAVGYKGVARVERSEIRDSFTIAPRISLRLFWVI